ncbi:hypothetical protein BS17DRAFT_714615 [Gyrodon lividus]|nr:hypothetical protein BS17DRAFT_714615 [Gyrodon lividus]
MNFADAEGVHGCLSFSKVEKLIAAYTGVKSIHHNMCPGLYVAFTGPFAQREDCPMCGKSHWKDNQPGQQKVPAKQFMIIPVSPQIQA